MIFWTELPTGGPESVESEATQRTNSIPRVHGIRAGMFEGFAARLRGASIPLWATLAAFVRVGDLRHGSTTRLSRMRDRHHPYERLLNTAKLSTCSRRGRSQRASLPSRRIRPPDPHQLLARFKEMGEPVRPRAGRGGSACHDALPVCATNSIRGPDGRPNPGAAPLVTSVAAQRPCHSRDPLLLLVRQRAFWNLPTCLCILLD